MTSPDKKPPNGAENAVSVLVLSSVYPRYGDDTEVPWLRGSLRRLRDAGCKIAVVAPAYKGCRSHTIDGIRVHRFRYAPKGLEILTHDEGAPAKIAKNPLLQLLGVPYIISGSIKTLLVSYKMKAQVLHAHWPFPHGFAAFFAAFFRRAPVVLSCHGAELLLAQRKKWIRPLLKMFFRRAAAVIANSSFTVGKIKEVCDREVLTLTMPTGTERPTGITGDAVSRRQARTGGDGRFRVLFVGRHIERKGIEYLITAAAALDPGKFQVRIAGHGNLTGRLKEQAATEAPRQVEFLGKVPAEDLIKEYERADCFVLPAIIDSRGDTEGLGAVLIEAAEYGIPLIASEVGGIVDVVIHNQTGLLVKEKSPQDLANAIQLLYNDSGLSQTLTKNCIEHVRRVFSWERTTVDQIKLYKELIK
ncbi:MAG: glycosyltransferase family 4 protein [Chitinispirillia bacterium]|nr:glycosyltransferase family 4 protein [Chitinispirillia bacterium]MCL2241804.1 glycosyltransferase family 4 protein [Chitinispirillia bacterium]